MKKQEEMKVQDTSCTEQEHLHKSASTNTTKAKRSSSKSELRLPRLSQAEMNAHWPFERLDPRRMPKPMKPIKNHEYEDALL